MLSDTRLCSIAFTQGVASDEMDLPLMRTVSKLARREAIKECLEAYYNAPDGVDPDAAIRALLNKDTP